MQSYSKRTGFLRHTICNTTQYPPERHTCCINIVFLSNYFYPGSGGAACSEISMLGQAHSLTSFGLRVGLCDLAMCMALVLDISILFIPRWQFPIYFKVSLQNCPFHKSWQILIFIVKGYKPINIKCVNIFLNTLFV